jgi:peptidoglycan/xylan/chitin deacetylase (PgdA/CDA1 family)
MSKGWDRSTRGLAAFCVAVLLTGCSDQGTSVSGTATPAAATASGTPSTGDRPSASSSSTVSPSPTAPTSVPILTTATPAPVIPASCPPPPDLLGQDLERLPTEEKVVALTFDAGANADAVDPVLRVLAEKQATGTFFLTGDFVENYPDQARRIGALYPVGNHSQTHPDLTTLSDAQVRSELASAEAAIAAATGRDPRPYFRFPFGAVDAHRIDVVNEACYIPFRWTSDTLGWKGTSGGQSADSVRDRAVSKLRPGEIVLMHLGSNPDDGSTLDADALPSMIDEMRAAGYQFVTLDMILQR